VNKLIAAIELIRGRLENLRRRCLKETPTRTIIIDPVLESMGWDVRDPDEVELEYPTIDGKSVDYALKLNRKTVLLIEAKALDDPLDDVKAITQVVGYATNDGIVWCALTNGIRWKVYRSVEKCPAPDKLMFEVSLDPRESENISVQELAGRLWRLSRDEMAEGTLDALGEQTFTDGKVRKALDAVMADPPTAFVRIIRKAAKDETLKPKRTREALARIWRGVPTGAVDQARVVEQGTRGTQEAPGRSKAAVKAWQTRKSRPGKASYDESHHLSGKSQEVVEIYRAIDRVCLSMEPEGIERRYRAKTVNYYFSNKPFCSIHIQKSRLRVWLKLRYGRIANPPPFARDVSNVGHWGAGDVELAINALPQVSEATPLIQQSLNSLSKAIPKLV